MAEQTVVTEPVVTPPVVEQPKVEAPKVEAKPEAPKEDLISRVSKFKPEEPHTKIETNPFGLSKEDYDRVNNDPSLSKFYKSMQADYSRKTQQIAEEKKQLESKLQQSQTWTPERLQQELNKPDFIQAATKLNNPPNSGLSDNEYSALTDKEKAQLHSMQNELQQMKLQAWQMQQKQQDEQLKMKYANYASDIVDTTVQRLVKGEVNASREDIWKVLDYDDMAKRAYELGKQDAQMAVKEKQQSSSYDGFTTTQPKSISPIEKGESDRAYFKRLALQRLTEAKGRNQ